MGMKLKNFDIQGLQIELNKLRATGVHWSELDPEEKVGYAEKVNPILEDLFNTNHHTILTKAWVGKRDITDEQLDEGSAVVLLRWCEDMHFTKAENEGQLMNFLKILANSALDEWWGREISPYALSRDVAREQRYYKRESLNEAEKDEK